MGGTNHFYVASTLQLIQKMASSILKLFQLHHWLLLKSRNLLQETTTISVLRSSGKCTRKISSRVHYLVHSDILTKHLQSPALQKWAIFNLMSRLRDTLARFSTDSTASFDVNTRRGFCTEGVIFKCSCGIKRHFHSQPVCATVPNRLPQGGLNFIDKGFFCQHHHCFPSPPCLTTTLCSSTWRGKAP